MSPLGIYFGPKLISIVETKGRRITNSCSIPQTTISAGELEEKVPAEVKIVEIIALFKDELRRRKIMAREATLCLSGKDLIIRTFDLPVLPKQELRGAVNFEAKKYIPFKVEELIYDFQLRLDKSSRINVALFMGIKKETLDRYISIFGQLNIKINAIEYSGFSVLRCMKLSGVSEKGVIGILGMDLTGEDEANFTVLEQGFPLFSRDISLAAGPEDLSGITESGPKAALEKIKKEFKVSLDYWHRKFASKEIKKIYLISNSDSHHELEAYVKELGLLAQFIDMAKYMDKASPSSLSFMKAYSASLRNAVRTNIWFNLLSVKEKANAAGHPEKSEILSALETLKLDYRVFLLALLICSITYGIGFYKLRPLHIELANALALRSTFSGIDPQATYEELTNTKLEFKRKFDLLNNLVKKQLYLTEPLRILPKILPKEVWLTHLSFRKQEQGASVLDLEGYAYLGDSNREFELVNNLVSQMKQDPGVTKYFTEIGISSLDRRPVEKITVTNFTITCKTYK